MRPSRFADHEHARRSRRRIRRHRWSLAERSRTADRQNYAGRSKVESVLRAARPFFEIDQSLHRWSSFVAHITISSVQRPLNLISDSPLVQETFDFILES